MRMTLPRKSRAHKSRSFPVRDILRISNNARVFWIAYSVFWTKGNAMPLDPEVQGLLEAIAATGFPKVGSVPAATLREVMNGLTAHASRGPELHEVEESVVPTEHGAIPVRVYKPSAHPLALIVYYHGGGWTIGSLDDFDASLRKLALPTGCAIVSVDYR